MLCFKAAEAVVAGAKIEIASPSGKSSGLFYVLGFDLFGRLLDENVGILGKSAGSSKKQAAMFRALRQQTLNELEAEWNRLAYKLWIVIGGESGAAVGQRVT